MDADAEFKLNGKTPKHEAFTARQCERLTDVLENTAVTLQNQGSVVTLSHYRWIAKRYKSETLKVLKDWILDKTE